MLYGRRMRTELPVLPQAYDPIDQKDAQHQRQLTQEKAKSNHDRTARQLPVLKVGTKVIIQNPRTRYWDRFATIVSITDKAERSYQVQLRNGQLRWRNRRHIRPAQS